MRTIQYFLIGFFLSLCTIPAFSLCPDGFIETAPTVCSIGNEDYQLSSTIQNGIYTYWISESGLSINSDLANFLKTKLGPFPLNTDTFDFIVEQYADTGWNGQGVDYSGVDYFMIEAFDISGNSLLGPNPEDGFFISKQGIGLWDIFLSGGYFQGALVDSPQALFNIDGIKENIFVTLLSIVGALLMLLVFKYAWLKVKDMLGDSGYDYYERSVPIGNSGLTRDTLYSNDGTVQSISYSNQDRGLNENSEVIFNTGASKDWDDLSSMRTGFESHWDEDGTFTGSNPRG